MGALRCIADGRGALTSARRPDHSPTPEREVSRSEVVRESLLRALTLVWLWAAALSQLVFLAHWPAYVWIFRLDYPLGVFSALARMGVYVALAWSETTAPGAVRQAVVGELYRTALLFIASAILQRGAVWGITYPASWAQGMLAVFLPGFVLLNGVAASGHRWGVALESSVWVLARLTVLAAVLLGMKLQSPPTGSADGSPGRATIDWGPAGLLTLIECAALGVQAIGGLR